LINITEERISHLHRAKVWNNDKFVVVVVVVVRGVSRK